MRTLKLLFFVCSIAVLSSCKEQSESASLDELKTNEQQASYALGINLAKGMQSRIQGVQKQFSGIDTHIVYNAIIQYLSTGQSLYADTAIEKILMDFEQNQGSAEAKKNEEAGKQFIAAELAKNTNLKKTASGLLYEVLQEGKGKKPAAENTVEVNYKGTLIDGTVFDETKGAPVSFPLNRVIKGWTEGLQLMTEGSKYRFIIPADLAYGNNPNPGGPIKPGMTLVFEVELISVK